MNNLDKYFYQSQIDWIKDDSPLKPTFESSSTPGLHSLGGGGSPLTNSLIH